MDSYYDECSQEVLVEPPKCTIESFPCGEPTQFQVIFIFSGYCCHHKTFLPRTSTELPTTEETFSTLTRETMVFKFLPSTSAKKEKMFNALKERLMCYRLSGDLSEKFAKFAGDTAWEFLESSSPPNNRLILDITFLSVYEHVLYPINRVMQEAMESAAPAMIPSSESSIESLKCKIIDPLDENSGSCSICLEDLEAGSEGVWMPCSHMFHGGCIRKWLRTSHYCPVCRFQMPTTPRR